MLGDRATNFIRISAAEKLNQYGLYILSLMKIALYSGTYVRDKDGAVKSIYQLVASFRKNGHEVAVWSPDVSQGDSHNGLSVHRMPSVPIPLYPDYKLGFFTDETRLQLEAFAPDMVHISTPDIIGRAFLLYARKKKHTGCIRISYRFSLLLQLLSPRVCGETCLEISDLVL